MRYSLIASLPLLLLLTACEQLGEPDLSEGPDAVVAFDPSAQPHVIGWPNVPGELAEHTRTPKGNQLMQELLKRFFYETMETVIVMDSDAPLAEKDAAVQTVFAQDLDPDLRWITESHYSLRMLDAHLATTSEGDPDLDAIAFYTRRLLDNGNVNADRLLPALEQLQGTWTAEEIADAANQARAAALEYLGEHCDSCLAEADAHSLQQVNRGPVISGAIAGLELLVD